MAGDAADARREVQRAAPDLILRDVWMPDIDGIYAVTGFGEKDEHVWLDGQAGRQIWPRLFPWAVLLRFVPLFLLNWQYRVFAKVRYRLFGQATTCIAPSATERPRFLD